MNTSTVVIKGLEIRVRSPRTPRVWLDPRMITPIVWVRL